MYKILLRAVENTNEYEELIKVFLRPGEYELAVDGPAAARGTAAEMPDFDFLWTGDKNALKKEMYQALRQCTGKRPPWGILTGIRPVKMVGEMLRENADRQQVRRVLEDDFCVQPSKASLALDIYDYQFQRFGAPAKKTVGIYIGIPFCPTRCHYCSFTSNQVGEAEWARYLTALHREIDFVGELLRERGLMTESLYIGGGTPTTLTAEALEELLSHVREALVGPATAEMTLEAGRADTITSAKLRAAKEAGVDRISINPQTMKDRTLALIGRNHDSRAVREAFAKVREAGIPVVNADLIAGLAGEEAEDFAETLRQVLALSPENLTIHSLAVKRASRLAMEDREYHYRQDQVVTEMLELAEERLRESAYRPYYLYRQKQMSGAQENIGYCREGTAGLYNVRIMDEHQTIIALGAGGVSKVYDRDTNHLKRVPNVSNYQLYIDRLEEMLQRKRDHI